MFTRIFHEHTWLLLRLYLFHFCFHFSFVTFNFFVVSLKQCTHLTVWDLWKFCSSKHLVKCKSFENWRIILKDIWLTPSIWRLLSVCSNLNSSTHSPTVTQFAARNTSFQTMSYEYIEFAACIILSSSCHLLLWIQDNVPSVLDTTAHTLYGWDLYIPVCKWIHSRIHLVQQCEII